MFYYPRKRKLNPPLSRSHRRGVQNKKDMDLFAHLRSTTHVKGFIFFSFHLDRHVPIITLLKNTYSFETFLKTYLCTNSLLHSSVKRINMKLENNRGM